MITPDTVVTGVDPHDISYDLFVRVLVKAGSPAAQTAGAGYIAISPHNVSTSFLLAVFHHESQYATDPNAIVVKYDTRNPGNCRTPRTGPYPVIDTPRGGFVAYPDWQSGWADLAFRLIDPAYVYVKEGRTTIRQIIERFAPATDNNVPSSYINAVVNDMNRWAGEMPMPPPRPLHVALSAGHHNTSGGNALEVQQTGPLTVAIAKACRNKGFDVRVVQGHDGIDMFTGSLSDVAKTVVNWDAQGWTVDVFLEAHTEGAGGTRGAFSIYPDWAPDIDEAVRDTIGPAIVMNLNASTGMPVRMIGDVAGVMSERQTGVGAQGDRLGVFRVTEPISGHTERMIVEFGAHDNAADLAIFNSPGFLAKAGVAVADAFAKFYGESQPAPQPADALLLAGNPYGSFGYRLGFKGYLETIGHARYPNDLNASVLSFAGWAIENEWRATDGKSYQRAERVILQFNPDTAAPFDVVILPRSAGLPPKAA